MKQSDTSRTGLEQLLISNAVDQSLAKVDFRPISEAKVVIKSDLLDCVDKNYIILATKSKLLANKCTIVDLCAGEKRSPALVDARCWPSFVRECCNGSSRKHRKCGRVRHAINVPYGSNGKQVIVGSPIKQVHRL